jgi:uncharacterized membrane protein
MSGGRARGPVLALPRRPRRGAAGLWHRLRGDFLAGLAVVLPVAMTVWIVCWAVGLVDARITPLLPDAYNPGTYLGRDVAGIGLVVVAMVAILAGRLARGYVGRRVVARVDRVFAQLPVIRSLHGGLKQMVETVLARDAGAFRTACLIQYPEPGSWALAFVAGSTAAELPEKTGVPDLVAVFMPTTPNPTTGFLFFVSQSEVRALDMGLEAGAKIVISAGLVTPDAQAGGVL